MIMKNISGYTLIELMILIAILGILMAVAAPTMHLTEPQALKSATRELHSGLHVTRSEAIRWNSVACICPSNNASGDANSASPPACTAGGKWEEGWIAFVDVGGTCAFDPASDTLVKAWDGMQYAFNAATNPPGITIRNDNASITSANFIRFSPRGQALRAGGASQQGMFTICDAHKLQTDATGAAMYARGVDIHLTGRARITKSVAALTCP